MADNETNKAPQPPEPGPEAKMDETNPQGSPSGYSPSATEITRGREQGLGMGQEDLNSQRDPTTRNSSEQY